MVEEAIGRFRARRRQGMTGTRRLTACLAIRAASREIHADIAVPSGPTDATVPRRPREQCGKLRRECTGQSEHRDV